MTQTKIRPYAAGDAERLAVLVRRCLVEVNSRDYPADVIAGLCASYTAAQFAGLDPPAPHLRRGMRRHDGRHGLP